MSDVMPVTAPAGGQRKGRVVVGAVVLVFAAGYLYQAASLSVGTAEQPGPAVFPLAVGGFLAVSAVATIVEAWRGPDGPVELPRGAGLRRVGALAIGLLAYVLLLPTVGHLITTVAFSIGVLWVLGPGSWRRAVVTGVVMGVAVHVVFVTLLDVAVPEGLLEI